MTDKTIINNSLWRFNMRKLALLAMLVPGVANAELQQNLFIDNKAMSLGNAVTADPTGIMDIHFNPAGLTKLDGRQFQLQFHNIILNSEAEFSLPDDFDPGEANPSKDPVLNEGKVERTSLVFPGMAVRVFIAIIACQRRALLSRRAQNLPLQMLSMRQWLQASRREMMIRGVIRRKKAIQRLTYLSPSLVIG